MASGSDASHIMNRFSYTIRGETIRLTTIEFRTLYTSSLKLIVEPFGIKNAFCQKCAQGGYILLFEEVGQKQMGVRSRVGREC